MDTDRINDIAMAICMVIVSIIGITEILGFLITLKWHCLMFAGMCGGMTWTWYKADYKSKGKKLTTLWQRKNTRH